MHQRGISPEGYIDVGEVAKKLGVAKSSMKAIIKSYEDFPKKRRFGTTVIRWREDEIDAWVSKRIDEVEREAVAARPSKAVKSSNITKTSKAAKVEAETDPFVKFAQRFSAMMQRLRKKRKQQAV